jgi:hypothetical protein
MQERALLKAENRALEIEMRHIEGRISKRTSYYLLFRKTNALFGGVWRFIRI